MSVEGVVSELRQRDRLSIELAAAVHDLMNARRRLVQSGVAAPQDAELAVRTVDRVEAEIRAPATAARPVERAAVPADATEPMEAAPVPGPGGRGRRGSWVVAGVILLLFLLIVIWWAARRQGDEVEKGAALFRRGAYREAAAHFQKQVTAHPNDVTARLYLARIYRRERDFSRAAEQLKAGLAVAPEDAALQRELGFLLLDTGRPDAAVSRFRSAVLADSTAPDGWVGLVRSLRATGQTAAAERVLARAPADVRALMATPPPARSAPTTP
jgi:tetratricopeptide (TPR) repeat protein